MWDFLLHDIQSFDVSFAFYVIFKSLTLCLRFHSIIAPSLTLKLTCKLHSNSPFALVFPSLVTVLCFVLLKRPTFTCPLLSRGVNSTFDHQQLSYFPKPLSCTLLSLPFNLTSPSYLPVCCCAFTVLTF